MASSSWKAFTKSILIPMLIALSIYVAVFLILLPLYRRYRSRIARYANYTPLSSSLAQRTTSLFEPYLSESSKTVVQRLREAFIGGIRWAVLPSAWARSRMNTRDFGRARSTGIGLDDVDSDDELDAELYGGLFDAESGEAMVGFDTREGRREVVRTREYDARGNQGVVDDSDLRLSRDLEQGFRDDSESEASDEEVTVGRRTLSRRGSEIRR